MPYEEWRPLPGYAERYWISRTGRIWGKYRSREMTPRESRGYMVISLYDVESRTYKKQGVHRLVLLAFVGACPSGQESCHENGDRSDNRLENLRWGTRLSNMADQRRHGTLVRGDRQGASKLTDEQVREIRRRCASGEPQRPVAAFFGITQAAVSLIVRGVNWAWVQ